MAAALPSQWNPNTSNPLGQHPPVQVTRADTFGTPLPGANAHMSINNDSLAITLTVTLEPDEMPAGFVSVRFGVAANLVAT